MYNGFINLNKASGVSSNRSLGVIKRVLHAKENGCKVGHLGTLDPLACGVLPVAVGKATRLFDFCLNKTKTYRARFTFGVMSDSFDLATPLISFDGAEVTSLSIQSVLPQFIGKIDQIPPMYSAKNIGGVRAYKLARKGDFVDLKAKSVEIYSFDLLSQIDKNTFEFSIECSSGTYIRSLARDLGEAVGSKAVMSYLCRERSGEFALENSFTEEQLTEYASTPEKFILPCETVLKNLPKVVFNDTETMVLNGVKIECDVKELSRIYLPDGTLVGIGCADEEGFWEIRTRLL